MSLLLTSFLGSLVHAADEPSCDQITPTTVADCRQHSLVTSDILYCDYDNTAAAAVCVKVDEPKCSFENEITAVKTNEICADFAEVDGYHFLLCRASDDATACVDLVDCSNIAGITFDDANCKAEHASCVANSDQTVCVNGSDCAIYGVPDTTTGECTDISSDFIGFVESGDVRCMSDEGTCKNLDCGEKHGTSIVECGSHGDLCLFGGDKTNDTCYEPCTSYSPGSCPKQGKIQCKEPIDNQLTCTTPCESIYAVDFSTDGDCVAAGDSTCYFVPGIGGALVNFCKTVTSCDDMPALDGVCKNLPTQNCQYYEHTGLCEDEGTTHPTTPVTTQGITHGNGSVAVIGSIVATLITFML